MKTARQLISEAKGEGKPEVDNEPSLSEDHSQEVVDTGIKKIDLLSKKYGKKVDQPASMKEEPGSQGTEDITTVN